MDERAGRLPLLLLSMWKDIFAGVPQNMQCPKCGHEQEGGIECGRCGIVFSKFQPGAVTLASDSHHTPRITYYDLAIERKRMLQLLGLVVVLSVLLYQGWTGRSVTHPPGVLIPHPPEQSNVEQPRAWRKGDRVIVALARFHLKGRVLSTERYRWDATSDLSPIDIALGWGPMSDQRIVDGLDIAQGSRRFMLSPAADTPPLPWPVLMVNSSNMHMIPADKDIEARLKSLRCGQLIELTGFLVGVQENGQWIWVSSASRTDTGDGACEIVWVDRLEVQ